MGLTYHLAEGLTISERRCPKAAPPTPTYVVLI